MYLEERVVLEVFLPGMETNDLPRRRKGLPGGLESRRKLYRLTIKWTSSKTSLKDFPNTLRAPPIECFWKSINCIIKNVYSEYVCVTFLQKLGKLWKIIEAFNVSKNVAIPQVFFIHILRTVPKNFWSFSKFFKSISTSHFISFKFMNSFNRYNKWKIQIFDPISRDNAADTLNVCQIMIYSHVIKDLNRNVRLNLNLE